MPSPSACTCRRAQIWPGTRTLVLCFYHTWVFVGMVKISSCPRSVGSAPEKVKADEALKGLSLLLLLAKAEVEDEGS
jgi:hypothetical protein